MSYLRIPGYDMQVEVEPRTGGKWYVAHLGMHDELIATGVATPSMLAPIKKKDRRQKRRDPDGDAYWIDRYFVSRDGEPVRRYRIRRLQVSHAKALRLIGVVGAIKDYAKRHVQRMEVCWRHEEAVQRDATPTVREISTRHGLRLIVDNTREAQ